MAKPRTPSSPRKRAGKSTKMRDEVVSIVKRMLPCPINDKVVREKEHRIAEALTEKKEEQEKMNAEILPRRKEIKRLETEIESLRGQVVKGYEDREVTCEVVKDYKRQFVVVKRKDTNKVVEERTMTDEDRQEDWVKGKGKKAEPEPDEKDDSPEDNPTDDDEGQDPPDGDGESEVH